MIESGDDLKTFSMDEIQTKGFSQVFNDDSLYSQTDSGQLGYGDPRQQKAAYFHEDWIFILIDKIAMYLSQIPWQVHKKTIVDGEETTVPALNHPLQRSLDFPNPLQPAYHFKYSVITDLSVTGNAFIFDSATNGWLVQFPVEICQPRIDGTGALRSYDIVGYDPLSFPVGSKESLDPRKVIHIKRPNPSSVYWGLSPLIPGQNSMLFSKYSQEYLNNYFRKGAQPGIVLQFTDETNVEQAKRLLQTLESSNSGRQNQRRGMILPKGVELKEVSGALADQQLLDYLNNNRERLINLYGVPKQELSIAESSSLGSDEYRIAIANFWRGTLSSLAMMVESAMTMHFGNRLGPGFVIKLNMSQVPALQDDLSEKASMANAMRATMTLNEVRKKVWKLPPVADGDKVSLPVAAQNSYAALTPSASTPSPSSSLLPSASDVKPSGDAEVSTADQVTTPDQSLNGAQVTSLVAIVGQVAAGLIPRDSGLSILQVAFALSKENAEAIMGSVGQGFEPTVVAPAPNSFGSNDAPAPKEPIEEADKPDSEDLSAEGMTETLTLDPIDSYRKSDDGKWLNDYQEHQDTEAEKRTSPIAKLFLDVLEKQIDGAVKVVTSHIRAEKSSAIPALASLKDDLDIEFARQKNSWVKEYTDILEAQVDIGYNNVLNIPFNKPYQDEIEALRARGEDGRREILRARGIQTFKSINDTSIEKIVKATEAIMQTVETGVATSQTLQDIARSITEIANVSASRAFTIARTEVLSAASAGQAAAMEDAKEVIPDMVKVWINAQDSRVRGNPNGIYKNSEFDHWNLQSEVVGVDEKFSNGLQYPRDTKGDAGNVINCRCSFLTVSVQDLPRLGIAVPDRLKPNA